MQPNRNEDDLTHQRKEISRILRKENFRHKTNENFNLNEGQLKEMIKIQDINDPDYLRATDRKKKSKKSKAKRKCKCK